MVRKYAMRGPLECEGKSLGTQTRCKSSMLIYTVYRRIND